MRGKVSYYNEKTHTGMVIDKARVPYEFKRTIWYDQHRLPTMDMYVDFRVNEMGKVDQIKESAFLKLQRKYDVTENDFWQSADEEVLEDLAVARREKLINDGLVYLSPSMISEDYSIGDCFLAFFADSVELIYRYEEMAFDESVQNDRVDYFKLKRFMLKAKSQLVQSDGSIAIEPFNKMEKELAELEFVALETLKQKTKKMQTLFEEIYLSQQIGYLRVERRLKLDTQRTFELNLAIKRADDNISMYRNRLHREHHEDVIASIEHKIARALSEQEAAVIELRKIESNKGPFEEHLRHFKSAKAREFVENFGFETEVKGIVDALRTIIDRIAFNYDTLLWQMAINSHIIRNTFYKQTSEGNFCSATFLRYYLKPLNKHTLSKPDETLYNYLAKYDKCTAKHVLVLSETKDAIEEIVLAVYANYKDSVAHKFLRAVDSLHYVKHNNASLAIFDEHNRTLSPEELAEHYAAAHATQRFGILVFNSKRESTVQFSQNIEIVRLAGLYSAKEIEQKIVQMLGDADSAYFEDVGE